jgi:uncharacterized protein
VVAQSIAERALALGDELNRGAQTRSEAVQQLVAAGNRAALEEARDELVLRLRRSSDDYSATSALNLANRALAEVGWPDPFNWKHRRKP